jgi:uncharacterized protein YciI
LEAWQVTRVKLFRLPLVAALACWAACQSNAAEPPAGSELRYVVFLRPDPNRTVMPLAERQQIQAAHMANIHRLADQGILVAAGPMEDTPATIGGIFVFKAESLAEASRVAALDPSVVAKRNTVDVHPWWGPAGIGAAYFKLKKETPGAQDVMASHAFCLIRRGAVVPDGNDPYDENGLIESLRRAGKLAAAGRIEGDPELLGIVIFKSASTDEARRILNDDPSIKSGRIAIEYHVWWTADGILPW